MTSGDTNIAIARAATLQPIPDVAGKLEIPGGQLLRNGHDKAKVSGRFIESLADRPDGKLSWSPRSARRRPTRARLLQRSVSATP